MLSLMHVNGIGMCKISAGRKPHKTQTLQVVRLFVNVPVLLLILIRIPDEKTIMHMC